MLKPVLTLVSASFPVSALVSGDLIKFVRSSFYYLVVWNDDHRKQLHYKMHGSDEQFCMTYSDRQVISFYSFLNKEVSC